ncbi:MAG: 30S ribosomal protein S16 [Candidatus Margulisbacteria bacterium GWF2_35_9]|nr:MAG: 30S ribosomal protein S16 [Candidatus Margulisbacteria bacterium GWF2_35_9]
MAVKIRLQRRGKKKQPVYRVVIQDSRVSRDGKVIEIIGQYNPVVTPVAVTIDAEQAKSWLSKGALPTKTVERLFIQEGLLPKKEAKKTKKQVDAKKESTKDVKETTPVIKTEAEDTVKKEATETTEKEEIIAKKV